jgi:ubiquinone/menaquinone biosynthesis C-methylase UbiE
MGSSYATHLIDRETEKARLLHQDKVVTQAMGGVFPLGVDLAKGHRLLDIACGSGGWALEVAAQYPVQVVGIDLSPDRIEDALVQAGVQQQHRVSFEVMDATQPLDFTSAYFDVVNARFITGFMQQATWPRLLKECRRVLKTGGVLQLSEMEYGVSSSPALQSLSSLLTEALRQQGRTFSVDGRSVGITHRLATLMKAAGFHSIRAHPFVLDASFDAALPVFLEQEYE